MELLRFLNANQDFAVGLAMFMALFLVIMLTAIYLFRDQK